MANSSTILGDTGGQMSFYGARIIALKVVIDTINTQLALFDTPADDFAAVLGVSYGVAAAHDLTVYSGATTLHTIVRPASSELHIPIGQGIIWAGINKGDDVGLASTAAIATMLVYLGLYKQIAVR